MRITQWGEYGVLISVFIAKKGHEGGRPIVGAAEIASAQEIALQYAQQILLRLRDGGVVESIRGPQGGYRLARHASEISLRDILLAAEGSTFEVICETKPLGQKKRCLNGCCCFLTEVWKGLREHVDSYLSSCSLERLVAEDIAFEAQALENQMAKD